MEAKNPKVAQKQKDEMTWLVNGVLASAQQRDWYGKITIEFKRGMVDIVRCEETLKPPEIKN